MAECVSKDDHTKGATTKGATRLSLLMLFPPVPTFPPNPLHVSGTVEWHSREGLLIGELNPSHTLVTGTGV